MRNAAARLWCGIGASLAGRKEALGRVVCAAVLVTGCRVRNTGNGATATVVEAPAAEAPRPPAGASEPRPPRLLSGDERAPLTFEIYIPHGSPYAKRSYRAVTELRAAYPPSQLRIVVRHYPPDSHRWGLRLGEVAEGIAEQRGFDAAIQFLRLAAESRTGPSDPQLTDEVVLELAAKVGAAPEQLAAGLADRRWLEAVLDDKQRGKDEQIPGAPFARVGGEVLPGARGAAAYGQAIDRAVAEIKAARGAGRSLAELEATHLRQRRAAMAELARDQAQWRQIDQREARPSSERFAVPSADALLVGPEDALVTVLLWVDVPSETCASLLDSLIELRRTYGHAVRVGLYLATPGAGRSRQRLRQILAHVGREAPEHLLDLARRMCPAGYQILAEVDLEPSLASLAESGVPVSMLEAAARSRSAQALVRRHRSLTRAAQATGDHVFFVNGRRLRLAGMWDQDDYFLNAFHDQPLLDLVDRELNVALTWNRQGTPRDAIYQRVLREGEPLPGVDAKRP